MSGAAVLLKALRERAEPKLTVRAMADALGMPASSYVRYETPSRFKKRHLPLDLARRIALVLADHGIPQAEVMALGGVGAEEASPEELSAGEERWLESFRHLDPDQRRLLQQLADQMSNGNDGSLSSARSHNSRADRSENEDHRVGAQA